MARRTFGSGPDLPRSLRAGPGPGVRRRRAEGGGRAGRRGTRLRLAGLRVGHGARPDGTELGDVAVKLLVVGPYPPAPGAQTARTVALVELLAGEGHDVEV